MTAVVGRVAEEEHNLYPPASRYMWRVGAGENIPEETMRRAL
jgi:hypothetical protein